MIKALKKLEVEGNTLNLVKNVCKILQQISYLIVKNNAFPQDRNKEIVSTFTILIHIVLKVLTSAMRQEKESKAYRWERKIKLPLFTNDMMVYIENPTKKLELIN